MNNLSKTVPQTKAFQSWQLVLMAVILLATAAISTFYFSSAQAQTDNGTITGLTLSSDTPGTLTVSWESPAPLPPTTGWTGLNPTKTTNHGRSTKDTSIWRTPPRPQQLRTSTTTPSTRSACVPATTEANTKANPGVARGQRQPYRSRATPNQNRQRSPQSQTNRRQRPKKPRTKKQALPDRPPGNLDRNPPHRQRN